MIREVPVLQSDPDFYLKIVGMMQTSQNMLKIEVVGNTMYFKLNNKNAGVLTTAEFYKMSVNEIWNFLGVSNDHKKGYIS